MPGISVYTNNQQLNIKHPVQEVFPDYYLKQWIDGSISVCSTAYADYPVRKVETEEFTLIIEGFIYEPGVDQDLVTACKGVFQKGDYNFLQEFVKNTDGEFIIACVEKQTGRLLVFNDYLGRLPFYYIQTDKDIVASREISFIVENYKPVVSKIASAEFLLFGYPLGSRTLHQDCYRLMPGSSILFDAVTNKIERIQHVHLNFEQTDYGIRDVKQAANHLYDLFLEACKKRTQGQEDILLSLSGGLDSRAILAAFEKLGVDYSMATYKDQAKSAVPDIRVVEQLIKHSKKQFNWIELQEPEERQEQNLFRIKQGLNYLGMSFILDYFEKIQKPGLQFWTGDGGDKVLPDLRPLRMVYSKKDLLNYILNKNKIYNINEVSEICEIDKKELIDHLHNHIESYPERSLVGKYMHFSMMERGFKWLFEGEDRNRYYFPGITPFYSIPFFQYAMRIPIHLKKDFKLFKEFLNLLSPEIAALPNANWGFSVNETQKIRWIYTKQGIKSFLPVQGGDEVEKGFYRRTLDLL